MKLKNLFAVLVMLASCFAGLKNIVQAQAAPVSADAPRFNDREYVRRYNFWSEPDAPLLDGSPAVIAPRSNLYIDEDARNVLKTSLSPEFLSLLDSQAQIVCQGAVNYKPNVPAATYAQAIEKIISATAVEQGIKLSTFQKQFAAARNLCVWVAINCDYDERLANAPGKEQIDLSKPEVILGGAKFKAICSGQVNLVQAIANGFSDEFRSKCYYMGGWQRKFGEIVTWDSNHAWNVFEFEGNIAIPADVTEAGTKYRASGAKFFNSALCESIVLPVSREAIELFYSRNFGYFRHERQANQFPEKKERDINPLYQLYFREWANYNTGYLEKLAARLNGLNSKQ